jgi:hypothetical protein
MIVNGFDHAFPQILVMIGFEIRFLKQLSIYKNMAAADLDRFARKPDYAFYIAFIRIARIPKNDDVAAFQMSPTNAVPFIINEFVDKQPFAVMKLRNHRTALDDNGLDRKNTEQNKNDYYQKNIAR